MMKISTKRNHPINSIFPLALFLLFALTAFAALAFGASAYEDTVSKATQMDNARIALAYLTQKVHSGDVRDSVILGEFDGQRALMIEEEIEGVEYTTCIYHYKGYLREIFTSDLNAFTAENGRNITRLHSLVIERESANLLRFTCISEDGRSISSLAGVRSDT